MSNSSISGRFPLLWYRETLDALSSLFIWRALFLIQLTMTLNTVISIRTKLRGNGSNS